MFHSEIKNQEHFTWNTRKLRQTDQKCPNVLSQLIPQVKDHEQKRIQNIDRNFILRLLIVRAQQQLSWLKSYWSCLYSKLWYAKVNIQQYPFQNNLISKEHDAISALFSQTRAARNTGEVWVTNSTLSCIANSWYQANEFTYLYQMKQQETDI